ncbi:MAG: hypothetical protein CSA49_05380, partial [Gammaproteobacteria bacterium]
MSFIKVDREFFRGSFWRQERVFSFAEAWLDLLRMARFEADPEQRILKSGRKIEVKQGEIHASLRYLSTRWLWSTKKTKRFIDSCIDEKILTRRDSAANYGKQYGG